MQSPRLILIMGLPGSGKTYFARALAAHMDVLHLNSDLIRKEVEQQPDYSSEHRKDIYQRMFERCIETLSRNETVIVDATFSKAAYRKPYLDWASDHQIAVHIIYLHVDEATTKERVSRKRPDSDADYAVYLKIRAEYEPIEEDHLMLRSDDEGTEGRIAEALEYMNTAVKTPAISKAALLHASLPDERKIEQVIETHISWVLLCADRVYKIKKPLKLSFLDFSTLEKRKHFIEEELRLNQRLCPEVYLRVLPIHLLEGTCHIGGKEGELQDYTLEMLRLDNELEMDHLLLQDRVDSSDIDRVLEVLIPFHREAEIIVGNNSIEALIEDFKDIEQVIPSCADILGEDQTDALYKSITWVKEYLLDHAQLIAARDEEGFTRDVHGDLHAGNIFLTDPPILFDCIEFNPHFRQIDLLNELAFFAMELDFSGHPELSAHLIDNYNRSFPILRNPEEEGLYLFYKLYRANVRMKVTAMGAAQVRDEERAKPMRIFKQYFDLYMSYWRALQEIAQD